MILYVLFAALTIGLACLAEGRYAGSGNGTAAARISRAGGRMSRRQAFDLVCLAALFLLLTALAALRLEVGNDYGKYVDIFHEIYAGTDAAYVVTEPGFNFLVRAIYTLSGFENYLLVFGVFGAATAFFFLRAIYSLSSDFKWSFALFMLLGLYFRSFTTVRYYFVLALALQSLVYLRRREEGRFLLTVLLAALFHKTVLVVIPLYGIACLPWKRPAVAAGAVCAVLGMLFSSRILELALWFFPTFRGTVYLTQDVGIRANAPGILRCLAVFLLAFWCRGERAWQEWDCRFYLKLNVLGFLLYTCGSFLPLVSRLAYYVVTPQILLVPALLSGIGNRRKQRLAYGLTALFGLGYFAWFLWTASGSGIRVLPYQTWIFSDKEWINGSDFF